MFELEILVEPHLDVFSNMDAVQTSISVGATSSQSALTSDGSVTTAESTQTTDNGVPTAESTQTTDNGVDTDQFKHGFKRIKFAPTPRMSTYLLCFIIGEYSRVTRSTQGTTIGVISPLNRINEGMHHMIIYFQTLIIKIK